jgi:phosphoribosylanthranilate isomerase
MPIKVKICGIKTPETLDAALSGRATHIGLNFFAQSPRSVTAEQAAALVQRAQGRAKMVGLFVDPEDGFVEAVLGLAKLDILQLHGDEAPAFVSALAKSTTLDTWKAIPIKSSADLREASKYRGAARRILYDAKPPKGADLPGGTGQRFDWSLLDGFAHPLPWILAGGLNAANVREAIQRTGTDFVDVSSGIESAPGMKDVDKISAFLKAATS